MERLATRASQFVLVGGISQQQSDLITIVEPGSAAAPEARKGQLYLVVEADADAPGAVAACQLAAQVFRRVFYADQSFSATAALRAAVRAANKALYEQNFNRAAHERANVGLTGAVLREGALYVVQVQPAQAYVLSEGRLRALPAHPSWDPAHVSVAPFDRAGALGASLFVEPELYRCPLRPGEAALICASSLASLLGRAEVETLLRHDPPAATARLQELAAAAGLSDAYALLLQVAAGRSGVASRASTATTRTTRAPDGWLGGLKRRTTAMLGGRQHPHDRPPRPAPTADPLHTLPEQPSFSPMPVPRPGPLELGESLGEHYERQRREQPDRAPLRRENLPPSAFLGEQSFSGATTRRIDLSDTAAVSQGRPYQPRFTHRPLADMTWSERLALPFQRLRLAVEERLQRRGTRRPPPPRPIPRGQGLSYRRARPPFPWALLTGLVLVVTALIFYGMSLSRQNDQQLVMEYFAAADERLDRVRAAADEPAAVAALDLARQAIDQLQASPGVTTTNPPLWLRYQELQREYERALAAVQRLTFFEEPVVLAELPSGRFADVVVPPPLGSITDTTVLEGLRYLYALDADPRSPRLYRIPRDGGAPLPYLSPGQPAGSAIVGPLRAAVWRIDQVVAVDQAQGGFGYYFRAGNTWNYSKLGASEIWTPRDRIDIEEYGGNLYVWGAQPNEVLRYRSGSYGDTPDYWFDPASIAELDLSTVVDMSVDGSIYLLRSNGTVLVFSQGQPVGEIVPEAITPPITSVTRFFVTGDSPENGYFFLLDSLGERIVQMEKLSGRIIQQIKVRPDGPLRLAELAGIAVDASEARPILYLANAGQIVRAELPPPPRPFREADSPPAPSPAPVP